MKQYRSYKALWDEVAESSEMQQELQRNPEKFKEDNVVVKPIDKDYVFMTIIVVVSLALLTAVGFGVALSWSSIPSDGVDANGEPLMVSREVPDFIIMVASTALGALAGLLVPKKAE